jgi:hypothetical protein
VIYVEGKIVGKNTRTFTKDDGTSREFITYSVRLEDGRMVEVTSYQPLAGLDEDVCVPVLPPLERAADGGPGRRTLPLRFDYESGIGVQKLGTGPGRVAPTQPAPASPAAQTGDDKSAERKAGA